MLFASVQERADIIRIRGPVKPTVFSRIQTALFLQDFFTLPLPNAASIPHTENVRNNPPDIGFSFRHATALYNFLPELRFVIDFKSFYECALMVEKKDE
ncbi:hypothetical protein [Dickeya parazeae]|uniref:hypothetical protein n=1 Tax=Dickeya parazeae TaxID=2893572 RepID=UPI00059B07EB|nr:hypothetical protein [Dickeya parazeae]MBP2836673.1 hypothetical protein [Dickeya parazeae]